MLQKHVLGIEKVLALVVFQLYARVSSGVDKWMHFHRETVTQLLESLWVVVMVWQSYRNAGHMVNLMLVWVGNLSLIGGHLNLYIERLPNGTQQVGT